MVVAEEVQTVAERGGQVDSSIQWSWLGVKTVAARVCPWCFRVSIKVSSWRLV